MTDEFIERRIIIGLIASTEFIEGINKIWDSKLLTSSTARILANWCLEHYKQYHKAPEQDIQGIYTAKLKKGLPEDKAEWIEDILSGLSDEHEHSQFNADYLLDQTKEYFQERQLRNLADEIQGELDAGNVIEAEQVATEYISINNKEESGFASSIEPFTSASRPIVKRAFAERANPLFKFPFALGEFWNFEMTRGGFVALEGVEKSGKTFWLMEIALRAVRAGCNVVFFQAGDMTENQQIRRLGIYLAEKSDQERYCKQLFIPRVDCKLHQLDECDKDVREDDSGMELASLDGLTYESLVGKTIEYPDHSPCTNCRKHIGAVWLKPKAPVHPLNWKEAYILFIEFQKRYKARFRLSSYPNETLTISTMKSLLSIWERREAFVPDVIVIDYADILAPDSDIKRVDIRDQTNRIWQRLRSLSQERHCLVVTATQAAASGYDRTTLRRQDFSEDKRKLAHVTAMYGLNQTDEEAKIGIIRINEIDVRESAVDRRKPVTVLQRLEMGRPFLGSFR